VLIPYNTDAPIYHFPWATIGLIVANSLLYLVSATAEPAEVEPWILIFGDGLHPLQWVSNNFLHAGFLHLLGNMIYLWTFGLIIEGKLGWWRFLGLYLLICTLYGAILQVVMLGSEGGALGASGAIYGLIATALVWAPRNEISCWLIIGLRPMELELSVIFLATLYIIWEFVSAGIGGFAMSSEVLHLTGAGIGAAFGVALLKLQWVDCEGWDVFTVLAGRERTSRERFQAESQPIKQPGLNSGSVEIRKSINELSEQIEAANAPAAREAYDRHISRFPSAAIPEAELISLIVLLHNAKDWSASLKPMVDYLRRFPENSSRMRLKLAQILLLHENRPQKALQVIQKIPPGSLDDKLEAAREKIVAHAEELAASGELEMEDDQW
jgi:membrane associated rhomboid family serine protease